MPDVQQFAELVLLSIKAAQAPLLERIAGLEQALKDVQAQRDEALALRDRLVVLETKIGLPVTPDLEMHDRLTALEAKAASPPVFPEGWTRLPDGFTYTPLPDFKASRDGVDARLAELTKDLSTVRERIAVVEVLKQIPGPAGQDGKDGKPGRDGIDGIGIDDLVMSFDGKKTLTLTWANGQKSKSIELKFPFLIWQGTFGEIAAYTKGDVVTWDGSIWHCEKDDLTSDVANKPGSTKAWKLIVKRGTNGRDAERPHG